MRALSWQAWSVLAVLFGLLLRLSRYLFDETLYNDEAVVVVDNVLERDFLGLLTPMVKDQVAPPGWLGAVKLSTVAFGISEYAFRLVPLLAALASVILFWQLAKRILDARTATLAVALFAACWHLANYGHFTKQYASDVAIASAILLAAVSQRKRLLWWAVGGSIAVWFSHPALFVLAGVAAAWILRDWTSVDRPLTPTASIQSRDREGAVTRRHAGERRPLWPHLVVPLAWLASFAAEYWLTLRQATRNSYLVVGWGEAFLPLPPRSMSDWLWLPRSFLEVFASIDGTPAGRYLAVVSLGLAMIGAVWLFRTDRFVFTLLTAPIAATIAASALKKYPFSHRLVFFLYPLFLLLLCAGLGWTMRRLSRMRYAPALLAALILGPPVAKAAYGLATQPATQDIKPLMRVIDERYREGDLVWVEPLAGPSFFYYRDYLDLYGRYPSTSICWDDCHGQSRDSAVWEEALAKAAGSRRVWVLATYAGSPEVEAERQLLDRLDNAATRIERVERRGCALTLYENPPQRADGP